MTKKLWFKAKRYGWGWTPCSREGWTVIFVFVGALVLDFQRLDVSSHSAGDTLRPFFIDTFIALVILVCICWYKGEKPYWRWGEKDN
jgi:hypothetical protein